MKIMVIIGVWDKFSMQNTGDSFYYHSDLRTGSGLATYAI